jgi:Uma2 family endonuclease
MNAQAKLRMDADEFITWAVNLPNGKRYELVAGEVVPMAAERAGHVRIKYRAWQAFSDAIKVSGLELDLLGDGMAVRIDPLTVYEPDLVLRAGPPVSDETVQISDPVIVVEVVSPSSHGHDSGAKLQDYFRMESVRHYLILDGRTETVTHHARREDGRIDTQVIGSGDLTLSPPGLSVPVEALFRDDR